MAAVMEHLEAHPSKHGQVLAVTDQGAELRVRRHEGPTAVPGAVAVAVEVPDVPQGRVHIVLCRWTNAPDVLAYISLADGASRPEWSQLEPTPDGLDLVVKWAEQEPRTYHFHWLPDSAM